MKTRNIILAIAVTVLMLVIAAWFLLTRFFVEDPVMVDISTDKSSYRVGEPVRIHIENFDHQDRDIYCPLVCAAGNFPTTIEKVTSEGESEYLATFCPSIEPLLGNYQTDGGYIIHPLAPGDTYDLEISNFQVLDLQSGARLRIAYFLNAGTSKIYSAEFVMNP